MSDAYTMGAIDAMAGRCALPAGATFFDLKGDDIEYFHGWWWAHQRGK
jgi:hypothetical protein